MKAHRFARTILMLLGIFFVITGVAKIFVFNSFAATISTIIFTSPSFSRFIAGFIVFVEIIGGAFLVLQLKLRLVAILVCLMLCAYIWVLYSSVMQGREIECNCFGILNISIPNLLELALDFFLFDVIALMALMIAQSSGLTTSSIIIAIVIVFVQFGMLNSTYQTSYASSSTTAQPREFFDFVKHKNGSSVVHTRGNSLILLLNFYDFNCSLCFDDFTALSDSVEKHHEVFKDRVTAILESNEIMNSWTPSHLRLWAKANQIVYPVVIAPNQMFREAKIAKSSVAVLSPNGKLLFYHQIPLGPENRKEVLSLISEN